MNKTEVLEHLPRNLFWDVNRDNLDMDKDAAYIIDRALSHGSWDDWLHVREYYGLEKIKQVTMKLRTMAPNALSYIATITDTPQTQFRCYEQIHSKQAQWSY
jgi:hypothetical protein